MLKIKFYYNLRKNDIFPRAEYGNIVNMSLNLLWKVGNEEKILPLRNWELEMNYQYSASIRLSKKEAKHIFIQSLPTLLFTVISAAILGFDATLTSMLEVFRENAKFGIAYDGMEAGVSFSDLLPGINSGAIHPGKINLRGFNLTTEPCLPVPHKTKYGQLSVIGILIILCLISCVLDAFGSRLRAKICNVIFKDRAVPRAHYLYEKIKAGRASRKFHFNLLVCQQLDIARRQSQFCPCCNIRNNKNIMKITSCLNKVKDQKKCLVCRGSYANEEGKPYKVAYRGKKKEVTICVDCINDAK